MQAWWLHQRLPKYIALNALSNEHNQAKMKLTGSSLPCPARSAKRWWESLARQRWAEEEFWTANAAQTNLDQQSGQFDTLKRKHGSTLENASWIRKDILKAADQCCQDSEQLQSAVERLGTNNYIGNLRAHMEESLDASSCSRTAELVGADLSQFAMLESGSGVDDELAALARWRCHLAPQNPPSLPPATDIGCIKSVKRLIRI